MSNKPVVKRDSEVAGAVPAAPRDPMEEAIALLEIDIGPTDPLLVVPTDGNLTPEARAGLDRMLAKIRYLRREIADVQATAQIRIDDIQQWADQQNAVRLRQIEYLQMVLEDAAARLPYGDKKSISLPSGRLGRRKQQPAFNVEDPAKALAFAKKQGLDYKHVEEPYVGALKAYWQESGKVPPGCSVEERDDKPYVEVVD